MSTDLKDIFCPLHGMVCAKMEKVESKQEARPCVEHDVQIDHLLGDIVSLRGVDSEQWTAINNLRRLVYMGMGGVFVTAGLGSFLAQLLINYFKR